MNRNSVVQIGALLLLPGALVTPASAGDSVASALVGSWRLVRYVDTPQGSAPIYSFGREPIGLFIFTADGHMSVNIMRNPPDIGAPTADPDPDACIPSWYCAYFGTYTVDAKKGVWVIHILGGNIPGFLGTEQSRSFSLKGDKLIIADSYQADGRQVDVERVLVRNSGSR